VNVHTSSARTGTGRDDWRTPAKLLGAIERRTGLRLVLDTACETATAFPGARAVCATDRGCDGLAADWALSVVAARWSAPLCTDAAWCNPPYSQLRAWMRKCAAEGARIPVVALIPARTDTAAFHESVMTSAHSVLLLRGRVRFVGATAGAPFPSAVVVWLPGHRGGPRVEAWDWRVEVSHDD